MSPENASDEIQYHGYTNKVDTLVHQFLKHLAFVHLKTFSARFARNRLSLITHIF